MNDKIDTFPNLKNNWNPWKFVISDDKNNGNPLITETLAPLHKKQRIFFKQNLFDNFYSTFNCLSNGIYYVKMIEFYNFSL